MEQFFENFKIGDFIQIQYHPNSPLNQYKGYIGEIKEYRKGQEHALVFIHARNASGLIKFHIGHLSKLQSN